jgi:uncharacterized protein YlxP (DUF503 family)
MTIGIYTLELHLPGSRSLKDRRQVLRRVKDRLRARHNLSIAELDEFGDLLQRAGLMIVAVAARREQLEKLFETVFNEILTMVPGEVMETGAEFMEGCDGGPAGWEGDIR